jgi:hypothetical protein
MNTGQLGSGHASNRVVVGVDARSGDMDPSVILEVFLYGTVVLGFLVALVVGVAVVSALGTLRHW